VDDDRETLSALRRSLSKEPYEVITAQGGTEALGWLEEVPIDLVITDQRMPGTSGTELLGEFQRRSPRTVRAILTGDRGPTTVKDGLDAGVAALLYKPWSDDVLRRMVRRLLGKEPDSIP
jgi:DNA-binding NtrC family response regulator